MFISRPQENNETAILANTCGGVRYANFVSGLGHLLRLADVERDGSGDVYVGGLDTSQQLDDGPFACAWHDEFMQGMIGTVIVIYLLNS